MVPRSFMKLVKKVKEAFPNAHVTTPYSKSRHAYLLKVAFGSKEISVRQLMRVFDKVAELTANEDIWLEAENSNISVVTNLTPSFNPLHKLLGRLV